MFTKNYALLESNYYDFHKWKRDGLIAVIHADNIHDSIAAKQVFLSLKDKYLTGIQKIFLPIEVTSVN